MLKKVIFLLTFFVLFSMSKSAYSMVVDVDKTKKLDEYVKKQHRDYLRTQPKHDRKDEDLMVEAIARGFVFYNKSVDMSRAREYARYVIASSAKFGIDDPMLVAGLIVKESRAKPNARSRYAYGLMQIYWKVHRKSIQRAFPHIKTTKDLLKPENNVMVGCWILSGYLKRANGSVPGALTRYLGVKNRSYISKVMKYRGRMLKEYSTLSSR